MTGHKAMETELFRTLDLREPDSQSRPRSRPGCSGGACGSTRCRCLPGPQPRGGEEADEALDGLRMSLTLLRCRVA